MFVHPGCKLVDKKNTVTFGSAICFSQAVELVRNQMLISHASILGVLQDSEPYGV